MADNPQSIEDNEFPLPITTASSREASHIPLFPVGVEPNELESNVWSPSNRDGVQQQDRRQQPIDPEAHSPLSPIPQKSEGNSPGHTPMSSKGGRTASGLHMQLDKSRDSVPPEKTIDFSAAIPQDKSEMYLHPSTQSSAYYTASQNHNQHIDEAEHQMPLETRVSVSGHSSPETIMNDESSSELGSEEELPDNDNSSTNSLIEDQSAMDISTAQSLRLNASPPPHASPVGHYKVKIDTDSGDSRHSSHHSIGSHRPTPPRIPTSSKRYSIQTPQRIPSESGRTYGDGNFGIGSGYKSPHTHLSATERAIKQWRNLQCQDEFFQRAYAYYVGKGFLNIVLSRFLNLLTMAFVVFLCTFLLGCVDHTKIRSQKTLSAVIIPQCTSRFSFTAWFFLTSFLVIWGSQIIKLALDIPSLLEMRAFYKDVLTIPTEDITTITWNEVMKHMVDLRDREIALELARKRRARLAHYKLDAHVIINRIMRRENYTIALFNKNLLDTAIPLRGFSSRQSFSKTLEWNVFFCLISYAFDERGQIRKRFLHESNREILSEGLRRRFIFMGVINLMFAPFIVVFLIVYSFFRYFEEIYHDPGSIASRTYTPYARWQFRNFNELPHAVNRRLNKSYPKATAYLSNFTNETTTIIARFVGFIAGSFAAILILLSVIDNELSLEFQVTPHRTVLFYLGLFGTIIATCRGMVPQEHSIIHPAWILRDTLEDLQYMPPEWRGKLHTTEVRKSFEKLFAYKALIFFEELASVFTTPFLLMKTLPRCSGAIIDFFREFTVHVDHVGYVCSFAIFNFERHGNVKYSAPSKTNGEYYTSNNGKMEQSFLAFKAEYPEWEPRDQAGSLFLQRAENAQQDLWRRDAWQQRVLYQQDMSGSVLPTGQSIYKPTMRPNRNNKSIYQTSHPNNEIRRPSLNDPMDSILHQTNAMFNPTLERAGKGLLRGGIAGSSRGRHGQTATNGPQRNMLQNIPDSPPLTGTSVYNRFRSQQAVGNRFGKATERIPEEDETSYYHRRGNIPATSGNMVGVDYDDIDGGAGIPNTQPKYNPGGGSLYLSTLPMVTSPGASTMYMSTLGDDPLPQAPGIFSLVNHLYEKPPM
ncbi:autophagy protein atg9 [Mycoemilia scoparia]|uniref:Autophagy-related protein 9 n=1 Tax=Mycoemilia scoparia TaxID=417184 RepID=A0A9W8A3I3_9FUNG|nr:autophagy protein atg9 [Mycoemilia scoparia]